MPPLILLHLKKLKKRALDCPPLSPDLNPVENMWSWMEYHIKTVIKPNNRHELQGAIIKTFDVLSGVHVDKLRNPFKDFHKRLKLVVEKKGYHIGY